MAVNSQGVRGASRGIGGRGASARRVGRGTRLLCLALPVLLLAIPAVSIGDLTARVLNILYVALGLGLVIFFHELGHFAVAKWCNVHVERFSIGFGPILWARKWGETEYALSAIPFGGYVKMLGQDDMDPSQLTSDEIALDPRSYSSKPVWQRIAIISAGVTMNIITAVLFFASAYGLGVLTLPANLGHVAAGSPAWKAGLRTGDRVTELNGRRVTAFSDLSHGVTLSSGEIDIKIQRPDGEVYDRSILPDESGTRRSIGVAQPVALQVARPQFEGRPVATPGTPAAKAKPPLLPGDDILAVDGQSLKNYAELAAYFARHRADPATLTLRRSTAADDEIVLEGDAEGETVTTVLPPKPIRELGLRVEFGTITAVTAGSPAAEAGIEPGDRLTRVDGRDVGLQLDPLRLPYLFGDSAGQEVKVEILRPVRGGEPEPMTITVVPEDRPGWIDPPMLPGEALTIPSVGVAYQLIPRVLSVTPESPAAKADIKPGDGIEAITLVRPKNLPNEFAPSPDEPSITLDLAKDAAGKPWQNLAFAFTKMQELPNRNVVLTVRRDGKTFPVKLQPWSNPNDPWYAWDRGIGFSRQIGMLQATGPGDALSLGYMSTRNTVVELYLTLRNLIVGNLSPKELHGPFGIIKAAYQTANEGFSQLLMFLGFLSVNLAVLNFLPIPVLDGGHMVFLIWEGVTRKKPSERVIAAATYAGMFFILGLMGTVLFLDLFVHKVLGS